MSDHEIHAPAASLKVKSMPQSSG